MKKKAISILSIILGLAMIACLALGLTACGGDDDQSDADNRTVLNKPTDFTLDLESGEYSFTANDVNAGYYYIRFYNLVNGEEGVTYFATSSRINGATTGKISGTFDMSQVGWGEYHIKLITYVAAGKDKDYVAPDPVVLTAQLGIGGIMETPEFEAAYSGNTVELVMDYVSLTDYYLYQALPQIRFDFYSDKDCSNLVHQETVDLSSLASLAWVHPTEAYRWGYSADASEVTFLVFGGSDKNGSGQFGVPEGDGAYDFTTTDLGGAGTYYVTATALAPADYIEDSKTSSAVEFTLTDGVLDKINFTESFSTNWQDPALRGMPMADKEWWGQRENTGATQSTTSRFV